MEYKNELRFDLLYVFKKLYERNKITKDEYIKAINITIEKIY